MAEESTGEARGVDGGEQLRGAAATAGERAVYPREPPGRQPLALGQLGEERSRRVVLQRQERELVTPVDTSDAARGEAAEPALAVVEQNGARLLYLRAPSSKPSSAALTSGPIVSRT